MCTLFRAVTWYTVLLYYEQIVPFPSKEALNRQTLVHLTRPCVNTERECAVSSACLVLHTVRNYTHFGGRSSASPGSGAGEIIRADPACAFLSALLQIFIRSAVTPLFTRLESHDGGYHSTEPARP
eukprot:263896-Rhodomonas_salina.3